MEYILDKAEFLRYIGRECHCCNAVQTAEERRLKYKICRLLGDNIANARRRRDWRWNSIAKSHGFKTWEEACRYFGISPRELSQIKMEVGLVE